MRILALETATSRTGVAVLDDARVVAEVDAEPERGHAAALLPAVERALAQAGVGLAVIDAFALAIGPGSFTGLRIGLATLKAFALGLAHLLNTRLRGQTFFRLGMLIPNVTSVVAVAVIFSALRM